MKRSIKSELQSSRDIKDMINKLNDIDWDFSGFVPNLGSTGIHGIHWYPGPFPPAVAGTLIDILDSNCTTFLDPFCGSGISPIEAWFRGKKAIGVDNNRFAIEICRSKIQLVENGGLEEGKKLIEDYRRFRQKTRTLWKELKSNQICEKANIQHDSIRWFIRDTLIEIAIIKDWILNGGTLSKTWSTVLINTLSSILHRPLSVVCNYHYTYIVDRSRVKEESQSIIDVEAVFANKLHTNFVEGQLAREQIKRIGLINPKVSPPLFLHNSAQNIDLLLDDKVDLVVTSPPYFGMNDYVRSQYLSWLVFQWDEYEKDLMNESGSRRSRSSNKSLTAYFNDMEKSFQAIYKVLCKGGYLAIIIGKSQSRLAREVDPLLKLESIIRELGFFHLWTGKRRVRFRKINNTPYRTETIWIYKK